MNLRKNLYSVSFDDLLDVQMLTRKQAFRKIGKSVKKLFIASLPFMAVGTFTNTARAQYRDLEVIRTLNFLLQIEFMLELFYVKGIITDGLIKQPHRRVIGKILDHHQAHVLLLKKRINSYDSISDASPQLNFNFDTEILDPLTDFDDFLTIAQVLEDVSVSAYKKYTTELREFFITNNLQRTLLRLHTTEARHATYIRLLREQRGVSDLSPWISSTTDNEVPASMQDIYQKEDNVMQQDIDVSTVTLVEIDAVREAFDEPVAGRGPINRLFQLFNTNFYID